MKLLKFLSILLLLVMVSSCGKEETTELTQEQEAQNLNDLLAEIQELATSVSCVDGEVLTFSDFGSKACGGPVGYIAYSNKIDIDLLLEKIEEHKKLQKAFNEKWQIISDCSLPNPPKGVRCVSGKPVFLY